MRSKLRVEREREREREGGGGRERKRLINKTIQSILHHSSGL